MNLVFNTSPFLGRYNSRAVHAGPVICFALILFLGKQAGVFLFSWMAVRLGIARLPEDAGWKAFYGVAVLCGIGFTMSLFIGSLAFEPGSLGESIDERIGILAGSFLSAIAGYVILDRTLPASSA